jgi:hypothetical protein
MKGREDASAIHSGGTGRSSLNWTGSSTSKRPYLLVLGRFPAHPKRNTLVGKRLKCRFRDEMFARAKRTTGKAAD